jgi:F-type H+-transporting ATPase subunit gamma
MATQREIKKRIQSVSSTRKITRSMEMVSTVKMKKMQNRLLMSKPYAEKLDEIMGHLTDSGVDTNIDLLTERKNPKKALIVIIAGNRGFCGGFNTGVIDMALDFRDKLIAEGREEVNIFAFGKKVVSYLRFLKEKVSEVGVNPEDKTTFSFASDLGRELVDIFERKDADEIYFAYTKVRTSSSQKPTVERILPITAAAGEKHASKGDYILDPSPEEIISDLIPLYIKVKIFTYFLESNFSEQFARRIAMKNANDAAGDIVRTLTVFYNRVRQAKITSEIAEIVGGAAALD